MDHRPKRRSPRRSHRVTPPPTTRPPLTSDDLPAPARTPPLVLFQPATNLRNDRQRPIKRRQLLLRVHMPIPSSPRPPLARHIEQRQLPRRQRNNATHDGSRRYSGVALGRMRPTGGPAATRPRPNREQAVANRGFSMRGPSQSCAGIFPAQREYSRSFAIDPPSGGGGNRTRVRGRTVRTSTSVVRALISPAGRFADALPAGQPSFECRASGDWRSLGYRARSLAPRAPASGRTGMGRRLT